MHPLGHVRNGRFEHVMKAANLGAVATTVLGGLLHGKDPAAAIRSTC